MELQQVIRYTGRVVFVSDTGLDDLETETVLQFRNSDTDEWQDVPTVDQTVRSK